MPLCSNSPGAAADGRARDTVSPAMPAAAALINARRFTCGHLPRLMLRCKPALPLIALAAIASGCASEPRLESHTRVAVEGAPPVEIRLSLSADRQRQQLRWTAAAEAAVRQHLRMLASAPSAAITIVDAPYRSDANATSPDTIVVPAPLISGTRGMAVEAAMSQAVARWFWRRQLPAPPIVSG